MYWVNLRPAGLFSRQSTRNKGPAWHPELHFYESKMNSINHHSSSVDWCIAQKENSRGRQIRTSCVRYWQFIWESWGSMRGAQWMTAVISRYKSIYAARVGRKLLFYVSTQTAGITIPESVAEVVPKGRHVTLRIIDYEGQLVL